MWISYKFNHNLFGMAYESKIEIHVPSQCGSKREGELEREEVLLEVLWVNLPLDLHYCVPYEGRRLHLFVGLFWEAISDRVANIA